ncbi:MAG TPA: pilus assembly protein [Qipengyuania sp.]|nr:pilus assembly protein [Qipengyuania sp.]
MAIFKRISGVGGNAGETGFLRRLGRDTAGNVFALTAAAVIPMIGVVGGAIDASRLYLTRSRLQAACDSAVLAGRKAMTTKTYTAGAAEDLRARAMFNFNYQDADFQTTGTSFNPAADANGRLNATAQTTVPMTLMRMFGFTTNTVSVACSADIQIPNIDIVFVLDVTGSMDWEIDGVRKIDALKSAAKNFYGTLAAQMAANGANAGQVRYGFVPYSQTVNGKDLFKTSPDTTKGELGMSHLANAMVVESRVANFESTGGSNEWINDPSTGVTRLEQKYDASRSASIEPYADSTDGGTEMSNNDCENYSANKSFSIDNSTNRRVWLYPRTSWPGDQGIGASTLYVPEGSSVAQTAKPTSGNYYWEITFSRKSNDWEDNDGAQTNKYRTCTRYVHWEKYVRDIPEFKFKNWTYRPVTYDVSAFKTGGTVTFATSTQSDYTAPGVGPYTPVELMATADAGDLNTSSFTWNGCLEERDTVAATNFAPIPSGAIDLNWLVGGTTDATRWRPIMDRLTYNRGQSNNVTTTQTVGSASHSCPTARMRNLNAMTQAQFDTYIDSLTPVGATYLDIGMVWGMRLIAPQGMFGARNLTGPNGGQISRHIIFMTDGALDPSETSVSSYGLEVVSKRITGNTGESTDTLHSRRFKALCDGMRGTVSIWAIGFGTSITGNLTNCADPNRAFEAANATQLDAAFTAIARDIADLRLVQ